MTDPDERTINHAIILLGDEHQDEREEARAALHRLFRDRRRLERDAAHAERALKEIAVYEKSSKYLGEEAVRLKEVARTALIGLGHRD